MSSSDIEEQEDFGTPADLLRTLQQRANALLSDLRAYQATLQTHSKQHEVELRTFKRGIESEAKSLNTVKLPLSSQSAHESVNGVIDPDSADENDNDNDNDGYDQDLAADNRLHALRSSNLPFYEAVWNVALSCKGIVALGKRVFCSPRKMDSAMKQTMKVTNDPLTSSSTGTGIGTSDLPRRSEEKVSKKHKKSAVIDIIADDGLEWIKVSTVTEKRLLFEMAKEGWEGYGPSSGSEDAGSGLEYEEEDGLPSRGQVRKERRGSDEPQLEIVKLAKILYAASKEVRVRYRHPKVKFVLPKVHEGMFEDVDAVIEDIRMAGVEVICGSSVNFNHNQDYDSARINTNSENSNQQNEDHLHTLNPQNTTTTTLPIHSRDANKDAFLSLLPTHQILHSPPTPTLNIDCTVLLALISDISHLSTPPLPPNSSGTYHKAITKQIATEHDTPLLPTELYLMLSGRELVCTNHAAQRMREIVATMGTVMEKDRARIVLGEDLHLLEGTTASGTLEVNSVKNEQKKLRDALRTRSAHDVPPSLRLPIKVVEFDYESAASNISTSTSNSTSAITTKIKTTKSDIRILTKTSQRTRLSTINKSVFLYGWSFGIVTVTSNRAVAQVLVKVINEVLDEEERENEEKGEKDGESDGEGDEDEFQGPGMYVCDTARSLIGKEKQVRYG